MEIADVAHQLYGLPPEEFTAARNACAKAAKDGGDRELAASVTALRKPTAGAWLLNQLVRRHRGEVDGVLELGVRLRAAQGTLGAADLRALDEQRRQLTRAVARQAVAIAVAAGRKVSAQVTADVEETLRSAMVDPEAGAALASGLLTDTFSSNGLEPVDLSRVIALADRVTGRSGGVPGAAANGQRSPSDAKAQAAAARAVADAQRVLDETERAVEEAHAAAERATANAVVARRRREDLESELAAVRQRLADLEVQVTAISDTEDAARRAQLTAARAERAAIESAARARASLQALVTASGGAAP
jgi:hypothetical protein